MSLYNTKQLTEAAFESLGVLAMRRRRVIKFGSALAVLQVFSSQNICTCLEVPWIKCTYRRKMLKTKFSWCQVQKCSLLNLLFVKDYGVPSLPCFFLSSSFTSSALILVYLNLFFLIYKVLICLNRCLGNISCCSDFNLLEA